MLLSLIQYIVLILFPFSIIFNYTYPYGSDKNSFHNEELDKGVGALYSFSLSYDGQKIFIIPCYAYP